MTVRTNASVKEANVVVADSSGEVPLFLTLSNLVVQEIIRAL